MLFPAFSNRRGLLIQQLHSPVSLYLGNQIYSIEGLGLTV